MDSDIAGDEILNTKINVRYVGGPLDGEAMPLMIAAVLSGLSGGTSVLHVAHPLTNDPLDAPCKYRLGIPFPDSVKEQMRVVWNFVGMA